MPKFFRRFRNAEKQKAEAAEVARLQAEAEAQQKNAWTTKNMAAAVSDMVSLDHWDSRMTTDTDGNDTTSEMLDRLDSRLDDLDDYSSTEEQLTVDRYDSRTGSMGDDDDDDDWGEDEEEEDDGIVSAEDDTTMSSSQRSKRPGIHRPVTPNSIISNHRRPRSQPPSSKTAIMVDPQSPTHARLEDIATESLRAMTLSVSLVGEALGVPLAPHPACMANPLQQVLDTTLFVPDTTSSTRALGEAPSSTQPEASPPNIGHEFCHSGQESVAAMAWGMQGLWLGDSDATHPLALPEPCSASSQQQQQPPPQSKTRGSGRARFGIIKVNNKSNNAASNNKTNPDRSNNTTAKADDLLMANPDFCGRSNIFNGADKDKEVMNRTLDKNSKQANASKNGSSNYSVSMASTADTATETIDAENAQDMPFCNFFMGDDDGGPDKSMASHGDDTHTTSDFENDDDTDTYGSYRTPPRSYYSDDDMDSAAYAQRRNCVTGAWQHNRHKRQRQLQERRNSRGPNSSLNPKKGRVFGFLRRPNNIPPQGPEPVVVTDLDPIQKTNIYQFSQWQQPRPSPGRSARRHQPAKGILVKNPQSPQYSVPSNGGRRGRALSWGGSSLASTTPGQSSNQNMIQVTRIPVSPTQQPRNSLYARKAEEHLLAAGHSVHTIQLGRVG